MPANMVELTVITTTSMSVVLFVSLIFLVSFDSPMEVVWFVVAKVFVVLLAAAHNAVDAFLPCKSLSRFLSASRMARKSRKLRITNAKQGKICTNKTRNLKIKRVKGYVYNLLSKGGFQVFLFLSRKLVECYTGICQYFEFTIC